MKADGSHEAEDVEVPEMQPLSRLSSLKGCQIGQLAGVCPDRVRTSSEPTMARDYGMGLMNGWAME